MSIAKREVKYAKEVDDVMKFVIAAVKNRKNKEKLSDLVDELFDALNGADQIDDELAADREAVLQTVGYRTGELADAFLATAPVHPIEA